MREFKINDYIEWVDERVELWVEFYEKCGLYGLNYVIRSKIKIEWKWGWKVVKRGVVEWRNSGVGSGVIGVR